MGNRPSIVALKTQAAEAAGLEAVPRESRPDDHQANGMVEQVCKRNKDAHQSWKVSFGREAEPGPR